MSFTSIRLKWARKLLRARYFVVMTENESAIAFEGARPDSFEDVVQLSLQTAELTSFYEQLGDLLKQHEAAVARLNHTPYTKAKAKKAAR